MIDVPPAPPPRTLEELAAVIAERLAHLYQFAGDRMEQLPKDQQHQELLDVLFTATAEADAIAKHASGPTVRAMLGA